MTVQTAAFPKQNVASLQYSQIREDKKTTTHGEKKDFLAVLADCFNRSAYDCVSVTALFDSWPNLPFQLQNSFLSKSVSLQKMYHHHKTEVG